MSTPFWHRRDDPRRLGAGVYGLVVVVSLLAVYRDDTKKSLSQIGLVILATAFVFFLTHVYTELIGGRRERGHFPNLTDLRRASADNWPLVTATLLPVALLFIGATGVISREAALRASTGLCLIELFLLGLFMEREEDASWPSAILAGCVSLGFGLLVIGLKALVH